MDRVMDVSRATPAEVVGQNVCDRSNVCHAQQRSIEPHIAVTLTILHTE
jgi:hypothetical protein